MLYKTILAAASGGTASDGVVELACRLARRFEAHVEGFHVRIDPQEAVKATVDGFLPANWIDQKTAEATALATRTKLAFDTANTRHALPLAQTPPSAAASAAWREETGYAPSLIAHRAKFFDLVVLGRSERVFDRPHSDTVEETLTQSGRPVLLAPAQPPSVIGETIALGWNGSAEAIRVLPASLPFLGIANSVSIITIGDRGAVDAPSLVEYLAWHGIVATRCSLGPIPDIGVGEQLLAEARNAGADLLVMGGYGQRPWRELLFGGATREVIGTSLLPVLLSH